MIEKTLDFLPNNKEKKDIIKKTCQRTFQALRIDVNNEFEVLYEFMEKLPGALKPGGRVAILTFHSGEDKLVKKALKKESIPNMQETWYVRQHRNARRTEEQDPRRCAGL